MPITRMFSAECDNCSNDTEGYWYKGQLIIEMKRAGWKITNTTILCPDCKD